MSCRSSRGRRCSTITPRSCLPCRLLKLTFDGSAPCNLCTVAQAGQDGARDQLPAGAALTDGAKLILAVHASPELVLKAPGELWPGLAHEVGRTRGERVPVPPPRA